MKTLFSLFFVVFLVGQGWALEVPAEVLKGLGGALPASIVFLGSSEDGKAFFVETSTEMDWNSAWEYCNASTLHFELVSVTSKAQADFLAGAYDPEKFDGHYWTAARDALEWRQFSWDYSRTQPDSSFLPELVVPGGRGQSCVSIYVSSDKVEYQVNDCGLPRLPICQWLGGVN